ncbi:MAG: beta-lactamase family protein, partial [Phaeodactylibacter sp.]|nr:beta-lactamase family protein [Phaeodactylibacter sp.]
MKRSPVCFSIFVFLLPLCIFFSGPAAAQQSGEQGYKDESVMPEGILGQRIQAVIDAVNANSAKAVQSLLEAHCTEGFREIAPMEMHIDAFLSFYRNTGGVKFHSIRTYVPERPETVVILKDELYGSWMAFSFHLEGDEQRVASLNFSPARRPSDVKPEALGEADLVPELENLLQRLCERDAFSGTVLVARGEEVLFTRACGEASKRFHVPNKLDTRFNLGSMNKMFTATAVMQLVDKGKVALEDPISKFIDESWLPKSITDRVTVHHLLTHTSGLGSYFNDTYWNGSRELYRSVEDFKPLVQGDTLRFEPGERFGYSNTGMLLLGVVIQEASGQDYFDYIRENIYLPAGMANTDCFEMDYPVENLAIGYIPAPDSPWKWENNLYKHVIKGGPAGGGFSTVEDLFRFARALRSGKLVSQTALEKMWTAHTSRYGYGFSVEDGPA